MDIALSATPIDAMRTDVALRAKPYSRHGNGCCSACQTTFVLYEGSAKTGYLFYSRMAYTRTNKQCCLRPSPCYPTKANILRGRPECSLRLSNAAVDRKDLASDVTRRRREQVADKTGHFLWFSHAAHRDLFEHQIGG